MQHRATVSRAGKEIRATVGGSSSGPEVCHANLQATGRGEGPGDNLENLVANKE